MRMKAGKISKHGLHEFEVRRNDLTEVDHREGL